ncbi:uncharacterized protein PITG_15155 [Phytophthora infestans T30-4]|uniref:Uncharacterized protein n=1 Tax=Phytophthora infestans (strain T30-4) TaxID=403677 RepID=D0NRS5_PHYIT|nr:uncharacterized protein PITG_15153 [Phytophthora infestans T30-4]XP_002898312.1 uncharacterized protein PITG_15155 [Phytophthora infestans T30-4]EEY63425.1 conserved hypothetical protein [Phytophthora infestans T30-4]EEY63427.1 conserved hypothetical protein [Phytophthora infestans T30-4]|eukprot:XP_002898310.1 conserved hypothetical protein [Phytophthora infestans T30-4]
MQVTRAVASADDTLGRRQATDPVVETKNQFRVWLAQSRNKYVDDLSTDEAMELFTDEFAKKWNRGKLSKMFYQGLPDAVVEQTKRTRHQWGFVSKLGDREKFELATAKDSVDVATKKKNLLVSDEKAKGGREEEEGDRSRSRRRAKENGEGDREGDRKRRKLERRRDREYRDVVMDELAPRATGREAQIEKRRQVGDKLHGAARDREDTRDGLDLSDAFLMGGGGGDDDLKRRMAQRDVARRRKQEEQQDKLAGLKAKESARMDKFLEDMGLAGPNANGGKPMTIAPRR